MRSRILACLAAIIVHIALIALLARDRAIREPSTEETRTTLVFVTQFDAKPVEPVASSPGNTQRPREATELASDSLGNSGTISQPGRRESPRPPRSPSVDWSRASGLAAQRQVEAMEAARRRDRGFTAHDASRNLAPPLPPRPEFHWNSAQTDRIEPIPGGTIIHLNDRCVLVISGLIMPACSLGKIEARGDLFEHMHDTPQLGVAK
jgi:hypothetical protein